MTTLNATSRSVLERTLHLMLDQHDQVAEAVAEATRNLDAYLATADKLEQEITDLRSTIEQSVREDFTTDVGDEVFPFVEDDNANVTGYGHQDPAEFAAAINAFDKSVADDPRPEADQVRPRDVGHTWAKLGDDGQRTLSLDVTAETPGAFPITTVWGYR